MLSTDLGSSRETLVSDTYDSLMQVAWNFNYEGGITQLDDLYNRAKENQWNSAELDWDTPIDPSNPELSCAITTYAQMPFFMRLSDQQRQTFTAHCTAQMLSQFLHAEQGALLTAATVAQGVPDIKAKLCAASQVMDEARHVEAYDRYINKIASHYPVLPWLKQLMDVTLNSNSHCKVMIGMNMILEGLALGAFNYMYQQTQEPLLKTITFNVIRDESRHVSFGHLYLTPAITAMHLDDREELAQFAFDLVKIIVQGQNCGLDKGFLDVLSISGIEPRDFSQWVKEAQILDLPSNLLPAQIHSLHDLMLPSLLRAGLITPRTKVLFEQLGVKIEADLAVLEAMREHYSDARLSSLEAAVD